MAGSSRPLLAQAPAQDLTWLWDAPHPCTWTWPSEWTANCSLWTIAGTWPVGSETRSGRREKLVSVFLVQLLKHKVILCLSVSLLETSRAVWRIPGLSPACSDVFCYPRTLDQSPGPLLELCWPRVSSTAVDCATLHRPLIVNARALSMGVEWKPASKQHN